MSACCSYTGAACGKHDIQLSKIPPLHVQPDRFSDSDSVVAEANKRTAPEHTGARPANERTFFFACRSASDDCRTPDCRNTRLALRNASDRPRCDVCAWLCDRCTYGPECRSNRVLS